MIVKYKKDGVWGYIDNIRKVEQKDIDIYELEKIFDKEPNEKEPPECYMNGEKLDDKICLVNKAFTIAVRELPEEGYFRHAENLLNVDNLDMPTQIIVMHIEERQREYEEIVLVTNESAYLLNDKGQTIERLN